MNKSYDNSSLLLNLEYHVSFCDDTNLQKRKQFSFSLSLEILLHSFNLMKESLAIIKLKPQPAVILTELKLLNVQYTVYVRVFHICYQNFKCFIHEVVLMTPFPILSENRRDLHDSGPVRI